RHCRRPGCAGRLRALATRRRNDDLSRDPGSVDQHPSACPQSHGGNPALRRRSCAGARNRGSRPRHAAGDGPGLASRGWRFRRWHRRHAGAIEADWRGARNRVGGVRDPDPRHRAVARNRAMNPPLHILIVDDHAIVRRGIRALLESQPGWEVVGEATTGREAVELAARLHPDIVIMDLSLPELNGLEATRLIVKEAPRSEILVLTMHHSEELA